MLKLFLGLLVAYYPDPFFNGLSLYTAENKIRQTSDDGIINAWRI